MAGALVEAPAAATANPGPRPTCLTGPTRLTIARFASVAQTRRQPFLNSEL